MSSLAACRAAGAYTCSDKAKSVAPTLEQRQSVVFGNMLCVRVLMHLVL
jgi:hypothetical protein